MLIREIIKSCDLTPTALYMENKCTIDQKTSLQQVFSDHIQESLTLKIATLFKNREDAIGYVLSIIFFFYFFVNLVILSNNVLP